MGEQRVKPAMASGLGNLIGDPRIAGLASPAQDPHQLLARILADEWTWRRFKLQTQFTVLTALALHHYLDPDLLGVTGENPYECLDLLYGVTVPSVQIDTVPAQCAQREA